MPFEIPDVISCPPLTSLRFIKPHRISTYYRFALKVYDIPNKFFPKIYIYIYILTVKEESYRPGKWSVSGTWWGSEAKLNEGKAYCLSLLCWTLYLPFILNLEWLYFVS